MLHYLICSIAALYGLLCFGLIYFWLKLNKSAEINESNNSLKISVIIPVRNEAENIGRLLLDLEKQSIPESAFEILIADDGSTDNTSEIVKNFIAKSKIPIKLITLQEPEKGISPKKRAIIQCIEIAKGDIILCTDGDCQVGPDWIKMHRDIHSSSEVEFVSAPVFLTALENPKGILRKIWYSFQEIEFASLILSGAASIAAGKPNMCSGANISYKKEAFFIVKGFEGNEVLASGDDEFLMHKMAIRNINSVKYLKSQKAIVYTQPLESLKGFYNQRKRWAGKWSFYELNSPKILAIFIFLSNLALILALYTFDLGAIGLKILPEFVFLLMGLKFSKNLDKIIFIPFLQLIYPFYVALFAIVSLKKSKFVWKERELN